MSCGTQAGHAGLVLNITPGPGPDGAGGRGPRGTGARRRRSRRRRRRSAAAPTAYTRLLCRRCHRRRRQTGQAAEPGRCICDSATAGVRRHCTSRCLPVTQSDSGSWLGHHPSPPIRPTPGDASISSSRDGVTAVQLTWSFALAVDGSEPGGPEPGPECPSNWHSSESFHARSRRTGSPSTFPIQNDYLMHSVEDSLRPSTSRLSSARSQTRTGPQCEASRAQTATATVDLVHVAPVPSWNALPLRCRNLCGIISGG